HAVGAHLVERRQRLYGSTGLVHVGVRSGEHHPRALEGQPTLDHVSPTGLVPPEATAHASSELVCDQIADVVPSPGVRRPGVSQPHAEPGVLTHRARSHPAPQSSSISHPSEDSPLSDSSWVRVSPSCSMPAADSASSSSASTSAAVGACVTLTISASGSVN